jgi:predicted phage-related endonuclease
MNANERKSQVQIDLADLTSAVESLQMMLGGMTQATKVDVAARLRSLSKTAELIDAMIKEELKTALKGKPGVVVGELFKANIAYVPTTRLNQKKLELEQPKIYAKYLESKDQARVTFDVR